MTTFPLPAPLSMQGKRVVGVSSGASAPDELVDDLLDFFRARGLGEEDIAEVQTVREDVRFMLPKPVRVAVASEGS